MSYRNPYKKKSAIETYHDSFDRFQVSSTLPFTHYYDDSESVTVPLSLLEQFNKLGMPRPISREELKEAMDYYNRICGNTDFSTLEGEKR